MRGERANLIILEKIIKYCDNAEHICNNHENSREVFEIDTEFQYACGMCIIQIGELAGRLDAATREKYTEIPWKSVIGMRNIFAHDYDIVNNDTLWKTLTEDIPGLKAQIQKILQELGSFDISKRFGTGKGNITNVEDFKNDNDEITKMFEGV